MLPPLVADEAALDFGERPESKAHAVTVPLTNTTDRELAVRLQKSCDCAAVEPERFKLNPGQTKRVLVFLDLTHGRERYSGLAKRPYAAHLEAVYGERMNERIGLELGGMVVTLLEMRPPHLHLSRELPEDADSAEETVRLKLSPLVATASEEHVPKTLRVRLLGDDEGLCLTVRHKAGAPRGPFSQKVKVGLRGKDGQPLPEQELLVTGAVVGRYGTFPAETTFGIRPLGSEAEESVRVVDRKGEPFTVVKAEGEDAIVTPAKNGYWTIKQRFAAAGERRGSVVFTLRDARGGTHEVRHALSWYGSAAKGGGR
ncbi:MAG: hypothetical protein K2W96_04185 [Gemmataceae bacterium]|nr:hypothetical protein [Gemmataceae bacterium]